jgi:hypothetical protein
VLLELRRQIAIRALEVEAEMHEAHALRLSEMASSVSALDGRAGIEVLARESAKQAKQIRQELQALRNRSRKS